MHYRKFGKLDWDVSALGFGAMRLPIIGGDTKNIDQPEAIKMIRHSIDNGVNYVDTAYPYHGGESEKVVGKALKDGYREKVRLATKMPSWLVEKYEDFDKYLNEQLEKLDTTHIDYYLLHGLNTKRWPLLKELGVFEWAEKAKEDGRIKYLGFSFHDEYPVFEQILEDAEHFTFCQIQLNYMDTEYQAGIKGLKLAAEKGLAVVIMEPIKGGKLGVTPPQDVIDVWAKSEVRRTPADWALQWVWNLPEVSVVLSGMSVMRHVEENLVSASNSGPGTLKAYELALVEEAKNAYLNLGFVGCTACNYCMPCPSGVAIPEILGLYNEYYQSGQSDEIKKKYWEQITPETHSSNCISCAACEAQCPQNLPIIKFMGETARMFRQPE
ncbi:MAG: aldo/keto reductase [Candidatus Bathyarchaeota archaeon]